MMLFNCLYKSAFRRSLICAATSPGFKTWDDAIKSLKMPYRDQKVADIASRMDDFKGVLSEIPPIGEQGHEVAVEANNKTRFEYAKSQFSKVGFSAGLANTIFDLSNLKVTKMRYPYTEAFRLIPKVLARGIYAPFLRAVTLKIQEQRDLDQKYSGLGLTPLEVKSVESDSNVLDKFRSLFSEFTGTRDYVLNNPASVKREDALEYENTIKTKAPKLVRIVTLSTQDLPLSKYGKFILDFELDPSVSNKRIIDQCLIAFKRELIALWRKDSNTFDIDSKLEK
jgi:hypothetical protein